jgi:SOS-response transcriptional repressor LexA
MDTLSMRSGKNPQGTTDAVHPTLDSTKVLRALFDEGDSLQVVPVYGHSPRDPLGDDGELVLLNPAMTAQNGAMVAARIRSAQALTLEYYHRENGHVRLQPADASLPAQQLKAEKVEIRGQVMAIVRPAESLDKPKAEIEPESG